MIMITMNRNDLTNRPILVSLQYPQPHPHAQAWLQKNIIKLKFFQYQDMVI